MKETNQMKTKDVLVPTVVWEELTADDLCVCVGGASLGPQVVDIEIPNYKIEELIKAGFKPVEGSGSQINVLLTPFPPEEYLFSV